MNEPVGLNAVNCRAPEKNISKTHPVEAVEPLVQYFAYLVLTRAVELIGL